MAASSKKWIVDIVKHLPKWFTITVISCCLIFVSVLTGVALVTERTVVFFPPRIGPGPKNKALDELKLTRDKTIVELRLASEGVAKALDSHHERIKFLESKLVEAREKAAIAKSKSFDGISESIEWSGSIRKYEEEIKALDEVYLRQLA